jgi:hypothetical protein
MHLKNWLERDEVLQQQVEAPAVRSVSLARQRQEEEK